MTRYLSAQHMQEVLDHAGLAGLEGAAAEPFARKAESFPWRGTGLDWEALHPHVVVELVDEADLDSLIRRLELSVSHLALVYSVCEVVTGPVRDILERFDELVWAAPGRRILVGATTRAGELVPVDDTVIEYDGADLMRLFAGTVSKVSG